MIFGEFPLAECEGLLLAHSLRLPDRTMKKGLRLTSADCQVLAAAGIAKVHGARLDENDLDENAVAGGCDLLRRHAEQIEYVTFDDDAIFADVDTPAALTELAGR